VPEIKYDIKRGVDVYRAIYGLRLRRWISTGKIKRGEVLVWRSGLSGWRRAEDLKELASLFARRERAEARKGRRRKPRKKILPHNRTVKNIMIVDDEKDLCTLLSDALASRRYNVTCANTKKEALSCLRKGSPPDLIFLDLRLPDGEGIGLLSGIKKACPKAAVNIITAYGSEESKEEARKRGVHTFIDKPFTETEILKSIKEITGRGTA